MEKNGWHSAWKERDLKVILHDTSIGKRFAAKCIYSLTAVNARLLHTEIGLCTIAVYQNQGSHRLQCGDLDIVCGLGKPCNANPHGRITVVTFKVSIQQGSAGLRLDTCDGEANGIACRWFNI